MQGFLVDVLGVTTLAQSRMAKGTDTDILSSFRLIWVRLVSCPALHHLLLRWRTHIVGINLFYFRNISMLFLLFLLGILFFLIVCGTGSLAEPLVVLCSFS